jgi:hypothetical protein
MPCLIKALSRFALASKKSLSHHTKPHPYVKRGGVLDLEASATLVVFGEWPKLSFFSLFFTPRHFPSSEESTPPKTSVTISVHAGLPVKFVGLCASTSAYPRRRSGVAVPVWCALAVATHFPSFRLLLPSVCCRSPPGANSCARITKHDSASWRETQLQYPASARQQRNSLLRLPSFVYERILFFFFFFYFPSSLLALATLSTSASLSRNHQSATTPARNPANLQATAISILTLRINT